MIEVVEYDAGWPAQFGQLRDAYAAALAAAGVPFVAIEHVGSTSVPGLAAKPVIDCDIVVEAEHVEGASAVLVELGFRPVGELGIPQRWAFKHPADWLRNHTYVVVDGCLSLRNHLAVRDALRADAALRDEYAAVKRQVATTAADIEEYGQGKNAMVQTILQTAGLSDEERAAIDGNQVPTRDEVPR